MSDLRFEVEGWIGSAWGAAEERATTGAFRIAAGEDLHLSLTKVEDTIGQTLRSHIHVPVVSVGTWLLMNWWRLRWERKPARPGSNWVQAHRLSGIGGDHAWPCLEFSSDGEFIHLEMEAEPVPDVSAIRYVQPASLDVAAADFEGAVERLLDVVESRLASVLPGYRALGELRAELAEERADATLATNCRWQALAGMDPGEASEAWLRSARELVEEVGEEAGDEVMGALPDLREGLSAANGVVRGMKQSSVTVDLSWVRSAQRVLPARELPWQRGIRLAQEVRARHQLGTGPLGNRTLSDLLATSLPLQGEPSTFAIVGGFRNGVAGGRTMILWKSRRNESQRFYLARLVGAAHLLSPNQHLVPVTDTATALQKFERSFAREFLCPWEALNAFTEDHGVDDETLIDAAEYFQVSEYLVRSTLVDWGKVPRNRLP